MDKTIKPTDVQGDVDPPSSKSYAQRAIAAALLADGVSTLRGIEMCDDTGAALRVVEALGARVEELSGGRASSLAYRITGGGMLKTTGNVAGSPPVEGGQSKADGVAEKVPLRGGVPEGRGGHSDNFTLNRGEVKQPNFVLNIGESGLSTRLFTPIAALCDRPITITGRGTILTRSMEMMIAPLKGLGVEVRDNSGFLPITVRGPLRGGEVMVDGSISSQFLTGLLVALPLSKDDTTLRVNNLRSVPYIDMTLDLMERFGVSIDHRDYEEFYVPGSQSYTPVDMTIEGDWSAASCLLVAGAVAGSVRIKNLNPVSLQADIAIIEALSRAGARIEQSAGSVTVSRPKGDEGLAAFEFDATNCPDLFPALAALAANCAGTSVITGANRLINKESDRAAAIVSEYTRLGIEVEVDDDVMRITGGKIVGGVEVESFKDHRMAMSLAVAALTASAPVTVKDAECVSKSYTDFWDDFDSITNYEIRVSYAQQKRGLLVLNKK